MLKYYTKPEGTDPLALFKALQLDTLIEPCKLFMTETEALIMKKAAVRIALVDNTVTFTALTPYGETLLRHNPRTLTYPASYTSDLTDDERLEQASPLDSLRHFLTTIKYPSGTPECMKKLFGVFSFDLISHYESLPIAAFDPLEYPDFEFFLAEELYYIPNPKISNIKLINMSHSNVPTVNITDKSYVEKVIQIKEQIKLGDIFQCVLARRFSTPCNQPFQAFVNLAQSNPSPYLFYFKGLDHTVFGASPETCVKVENKNIILHPIAGTRPRAVVNGFIDPDLDKRHEAELKLDHKETAEHMMLVDLARNDVARISETGSRTVKDLLIVEKFSQVMHLVSRVTGKLKHHLDGLHAYGACLNMGTLSGAPKIEATKILRRFENEKRGPYGGGIGWIAQNGDVDTGIIIRSACVKHNIAHVTAGAGIVYDSIPEIEAAETTLKAKAVLQAIAYSEENSNANTKAQCYSD
jgi:anthranilate synthase component I